MKTLKSTILITSALTAVAIACQGIAQTDPVTESIGAANEGYFTRVASEVADESGPAKVAAHDAYLKGLSFYLRNTPTDNAKAEVHFKHAVELDPDFRHAYVALAKVYAKSVEPEYSLAIGIYWRKALFLTHQNLAKSAGENFPDAHVLRAWMAMYKHQPGTALREAERALDLNANDVDALKAKASAFIYLGQYSEGRKLANRIIRLDPVVLAEPQYIIGLSYFASGSYDKSADYIERALENDPTTGKYALLLAAAYGKLGMENEAKQAMLKFRKSWRGPFWIAVAVYYYPFEDGEILKHLADGFKAAGVAERPPSRYLKLDRENRLSGAQIRSLLFGHRIKGSDFWSGNGWAQKRTLEGKVSHSGQSMYTRNTDARDEGESWIEENQLCDRWSEVEGAITSCVLIYRESDGAENDYYMLTDQGPQPFRVSN